MNYEQLSDEQLMAHVQNQDRGAYRILYDRYKRAVLGLSYRIVGDSAVAEEIMQETFWRIWKNSDGFNHRRGTFPNWMFGIARNLSIDTVRRKKKFEMHPLPDDQFESESPGRPLPADHDVQEIAWTSLQHQKIKLAMADLPDDQRDVVNWIYFKGMTRREIAHVHNIPFGTINTRARLALDKLKRSLLAMGVEE